MKIIKYKILFRVPGTFSETMLIHNEHEWKESKKILRTKSSPDHFPCMFFKAGKELDYFIYPEDVVLLVEGILGGTYSGKISLKELSIFLPLLKVTVKSGVKKHVGRQTA